MTRSLAIALAFSLTAGIAGAQTPPVISIEPVDGVVERGTAGTTQRVRITRTGDTSQSSTVQFQGAASGANPALTSDFTPSGFPAGVATFQGDAVVAWKTTGLESPPAMTQNPLIVTDVCPEDPGWPTSTQGAGRDIKVVLPTNRTCQPNMHTPPGCPGNTNGKLKTEIGGSSGSPARNIWIVGGKIENKWGQTAALCDGGTTRADAGAGAISLQFYTGTAFIEGVHIDLKCTCEDAIRSNQHRSTSRVVIQNVRAEGFAQCNPGTHGDLIHPQSGYSGQSLAEIKLENVSVLRDNQVVWATPRTTGHGVRDKLTLDHVTINKRDCPEAAGDGWVLGWRDPDGSTLTTSDVRFRETYITSINTPYGTTPHWSSFDANNCAIYPADANVKEGKWCLQAKDAELFVPLSRVGRNYSRALFTTP